MMVYCVIFHLRLTCLIKLQNIPVRSLFYVTQIILWVVGNWISKKLTGYDGVSVPTEGILLFKPAVVYCKYACAQWKHANLERWKTFHILRKHLCTCQSYEVLWTAIILIQIECHTGSCHTDTNQLIISHFPKLVLP